jgi:hypothetical protein
VFEKGPLHVVQTSAALKPFNGGDFRSHRFPHGFKARPCGDSVNQDGAGTARSFAASVLAAREVEVVTQDNQQIFFGRNVNSMLYLVYKQIHAHRLPKQFNELRIVAQPQ